MKIAINGLKSNLLAHLEEIAFFLEIHGENPFKIRALKNAEESLGNIEDPELATKIKDDSLLEIKGIGKGILAISKAFLSTGTSPELKEARKDLPSSLLEMRPIRGLGPKKILHLFEGLQIKSLGELEYACNENRLVTLPGFGEKTQQKILKEIQLAKTRRGKHLLSDALQWIASIESEFLKKITAVPVGDLGRKLEIIHQFEYLVVGDQIKRDLDKISDLTFVKKFERLSATQVRVETSGLAPLHFLWVPKDEEIYHRIRLTSSDEHWKSLERFANKKGLQITPNGFRDKSRTTGLRSEQEFYEFLGLSFCTPEARELPADQIPKSGFLESLTGVFHLHTLASDGLNSLEEMKAAAQKCGWSYMGLSDHSKTAAYAQGLDESALKKQWAEVDALNRDSKNFKIFKGIESDILKDGSLDYSPSVLKQFDFVIASIHSRYGMTEMTDRIIHAIENEFTTMIGHLSGRLLLAREAYGLNYEKIIDAAIRNETVIEFNANPYRLDMDWTHLHRACEKGLIISINPDAHSVDGFDDIKYGIWMARKAYISNESILNTWGLHRVEKFLDR